MDTNPYKLKTAEVDWKKKEKPPTGYLDSSSFLSKPSFSFFKPSISFSNSAVFSTLFFLVRSYPHIKILLVWVSRF